MVISGNLTHVGYADTSQRRDGLSNSLVYDGCGRAIWCPCQPARLRMGRFVIVGYGVRLVEIDSRVFT